MKKELLFIINNLKNDIEISKKNGLFNLEKLLSNDFATLKTGNKEIKRIEEFKNLNIEDLPSDVVADEELYCVVYHYVLIEAQKEFLNYDRDLADKLGLSKVDYPNTDKVIEYEIIEDAVPMGDLFTSLELRISEKKVDASKIDFIDESVFTDKQLKVIRLYLEGYKKVKIAEILNVNKSAVTKIIQRYTER